MIFSENQFDFHINQSGEQYGDTDGAPLELERRGFFRSLRISSGIRAQVRENMADLYAAISKIETFNISDRFIYLRPITPGIEDI